MKDMISAIKNIGYEQFSGASNTTAVDRQGFEGVLFLGTVSEADTTNLKVEESADNVTFTDAAANVVYGDTGVVADDANFKIGYTGYKRYARIADTAAGATVDAVSVLGHPAHAPQA